MIPQEYEEQDPDHYPENAPPPLTPTRHKPHKYDKYSFLMKLSVEHESWCTHNLVLLICYHLVYILHRFIKVNQSINLVYILHRFSKLNQSINLVYILHRFSRFNQSIDLVYILNRFSKFIQSINLLYILRRFKRNNQSINLVYILYSLVDLINQSVSQSSIHFSHV